MSNWDLQNNDWPCGRSLVKQRKKKSCLLSEVNIMRYRESRSCLLVIPTLDRRLTLFWGLICGTLYPQNLKWIVDWLIISYSFAPFPSSPSLCHYLVAPTSQSSSDGALSPPGLQEALVDGGDSGDWKPAVFGRAAGLGLPAHHAEEGRLLLPPVLR